jgi:two-component system, chemotaxis family, CheB/CheR fusion protein
MRSNSMSKSISVLLLHHDAKQIRLISEMMSEISESPFQLETFTSLEEGFEALGQKEIDVMLLDLVLVRKATDMTLDAIRSQAAQIPLVILAQKKQDVSSMTLTQADVQEYILQSEMSPRLLELTLRYAYERHQSQVALRRTETRLQFLIENIQDFSIYSTDVNGYIDFWNTGAERIFGYSEAEILGQHMEILFTPEDRAQDMPEKEMQDAVQKGLALDERWHLKKGAVLFYASGVTRPLYDDRNRLIGFIKVARDLTERQMANEQRETLLQSALEARTEAEQTNTIKEEFLALIAHEMRTPLASIVGFASMMTSKTMTWPRESLVEYAAIIEDEAQRMSGLIEQLTDHARQRTGTLKIDFETTSFETIIRSAMPQLNALTTQHHLLVDIPKGLPSIQADPQRIAQVLTNLVGNAARYSEPQTQVTIHAQTEGRYLQVDVIDEGRGIPAEQREQVFQPFHQIDRSSTKGLGLGLALCKDLVERHKGRIWVQDYDGPGTIISFTLPTLDGRPEKENKR